MDTLTVLREARARYASAPCHLPMGEFPKPGTYCVVTALDKANGDYCGSLVTALGMSRGDLIKWNAEHSTEEVLALFDRAIAAEEAKSEKQEKSEIPQATPRRRDNAGCDREPVVA